MKRIRLTLGIAVLAALACTAMPAAASAATTRYASPTGSGSACTQSEPCDIYTAAEGPAVANGDEAVLLPGTYVLSKTLLVSRAVDVHGEAGAPRPVIESGIVEGLKVENPGAVVEGIELRDSHGGGAALDLAGGTVDGVVAIETGGSSIACFLYPALPLLLRDSACLATGEGGYGVMSSYVTTSEARIDRLRNVTAMALGPHSAGIYVSASGTPPGSVTLDGLDVIASGTEFDVAAFASAASAPAEVVLSHSNFHSRHEQENGAVTEPGSATNQTARPLLADPAAGDFRELPGSPTIDAGATDAFTGPLDLDGAPRLQGAAPDIGAAELTPPAPPGPPVPPNTTIVKAKIKRTKHRAKFVFKASGGTGPFTFKCRLDKGKFKPCRSPKLYKRLKRGRHVFQVEAVDSAGAVDPTPAKRKFKA